MLRQIQLERFTSELFSLLEETFERVQGIYLDGGTSLFETLDGMTAKQASRRTSDACYSIAAHVEHTAFYLRVLQNHILGKDNGKVDWEEIWRNDHAVTPEEWDALKAQLRATYDSVKETLNGLGDWEGGNDIGGALAIVVHTAYHLGSIRHLTCGA